MTEQIRIAWRIPPNGKTPERSGATSWVDASSEVGKSLAEQAAALNRVRGQGTHWVERRPAT